MAHDITARRFGATPVVLEATGEREHPAGSQCYVSLYTAAGGEHWSLSGVDLSIPSPVATKSAAAQSETNTYKWLSTLYLGVESVDYMYVEVTTFVRHSRVVVTPSSLHLVGSTLRRFSSFILQQLWP